MFINTASAPAYLGGSFLHADEQYILRWYSVIVGSTVLIRICSAFTSVCSIADTTTQCRDDPHALGEAPLTLPARRFDETAAARHTRITEDMEQSLIAQSAIPAHCAAECRYSNFKLTYF
jgi:hypothetical protein